MGILDFYKYIIERENGTFRIKKDNEIYGTYNNIQDALHDRDLLISCDWDVAEMNARDEVPNKYYDMDLPPSRKYITLKKQGNNLYYFIRKTINGEQRFFGQYKTFMEAAKKRDELVKNNWRVE